MLNNLISQLLLIAANFGGVMGCAIGMSVASACEIIYWLTLKPVAKFMVSYNMNLTARAKYVYKILFLLIFFAWCTFSYYHFHKVYVTYINRKYSTWNKCFNALKIQARLQGAIPVQRKWSSLPEGVFPTTISNIPSY